MNWLEIMQTISTVMLFTALAANLWLIRRNLRDAHQINVDLKKTTAILDRATALEQSAKALEQSAQDVRKKDQYHTIVALDGLTMALELVENGADLARLKESLKGTLKAMRRAEDYDPGVQIFKPH